MFMDINKIVLCREGSVEPKLKEGEVAVFLNDDSWTMVQMIKGLIGELRKLRSVWVHS